MTDAATEKAQTEAFLSSQREALKAQGVSYEHLALGWLNGHDVILFLASSRPGNIAGTCVRAQRVVFLEFDVNVAVEMPNGVKRPAVTAPDLRFTLGAEVQLCLPMAQWLDAMPEPAQAAALMHLIQSGADAKLLADRQLRLVT